MSDTRQTGAVAHLRPQPHVESDVEELEDEAKHPRDGIAQNKLQQKEAQSGAAIDSPITKVTTSDDAFSAVTLFCMLELF